MRIAAFILGFFAFGVAFAHADAVSDALAAATTAYAAGDLSAAKTQIEAAGKEIAAMQSALLSIHFPEAPEGWTRVDTAGFAEAFGIIGGGTGAEATYTSAAGESVTLSAYADNDMVQSFAGVLDNPAMMAMMGTTVEIGGVAFIVQEGNTTMALLENRVLLQANGDPAKAQDLLGRIDLAALAAFDRR
jgi:hypothetical protein